MIVGKEPSGFTGGHIVGTYETIPGTVIDAATA